MATIFLLWISSAFALSDIDPEIILIGGTVFWFFTLTVWITLYWYINKPNVKVVRIETKEMSVPTI